MDYSSDVTDINIAVCRDSSWWAALFILLAFLQQKCQFTFMRYFESEIPLSASVGGGIFYFVIIGYLSVMCAIISVCNSRC